MILGRSVSRNATLFAECAAVVQEGGGTLNHRQFGQRVWRLADGLSQVGLGKGDRVGILSRNCADFLCSYFAIGGSGIWMVPLNYALKAADIDVRMAHAEVNAIIVGADLVDVVRDLSAEVLNRLAGRIFVIGLESAGFSSLNELVESGRAVPPDVHIGADDTLYVGYTSGTTGAPKGVLVPHRAIVSGFLYKAVAYSLTENDISINGGPYWHSAPLDFASLAVYLGGTAIVPAGFDPQGFLALVEEFKATNSFVVPTMLQMIMSSPALDKYDLSSWRRVVSGGAPLPEAVKNQVLERLGPVLYEFYGATETRSLAYITPAELVVRERSVGRLNRDVELRILNEAGDEMPAGEVGEFYVRGPGLFNGYHRDPEKTSASFRGDWFSLGDMGRIDDDGYLYLVDRKNDMIITGGENVFPNDIEETIRRMPGIIDAAVVGLPDDKWGEVIAAFVEAEADLAIDPASIVEFCGRHLPNFMKPRRIEFVEALPRNTMGKVLRRVLREPHWAGKLGI